MQNFHAARFKRNSTAATIEADGQHCKHQTMTQTKILSKFVLMNDCVAMAILHKAGKLA